MHAGDTNDRNEGSAPFMADWIGATFPVMTEHDPASAGTGAANGLRYRKLILALIALGALGLIGELVLLEHYEDPWQWAPLAALGAGLFALIGVTVRPGPGTIRFLQVVSVTCVVLGVVGLWLHLSGNIEFELEGNPELRGWPLYWEALRGAVPALAPGALAQLGLLGLLFAHHHPAANRPRG